MAKQFKIYFSESDEIATETFDPDIGEEKVSIRRFEIEMLSAIYKIATRFQTAISDSYECEDVVNQLKNIDDNAVYIELTKKDIEYAKTGWAKSAGVRPYAWNKHGKSILLQIEKPFDPESTIEWNEKLGKHREV